MPRLSNGYSGAIRAKGLLGLNEAALTGIHGGGNGNTQRRNVRQQQAWPGQVDGNHAADVFPNIVSVTLNDIL